uniref:Glutaredoxin domain-containing protein n=2 Tax=Aureoumbra lagunensis TaxID=44058 RepID=A0A7S3JXE0_9STRA
MNFMVLMAFAFPLLGTTFSNLQSLHQQRHLKKTIRCAAERNPTLDRIDTLVKENNVFLFMKGTKIFPQCGFSNMAVQILNAIGSDYETFDVLSDENIRSGIKEYSDWPTIPQLYVNGEFIGGSDIMLEMYQEGELQEMIEVASAS